MQLAAAHLLSLGTIAAGTRRPHTGPPVRPPIVDDSTEGATIEDGLAPPERDQDPNALHSRAWAFAPGAQTATGAAAA